VNHGWQSESTEGPTGGWNVELSICLSVYPSIYLSFFSPYWSICLSTYPSLCLSIHLLSSLSVYAAVHPSSYFCLCVHLSIFLSTPLFQDLSISLSLYLSVVLWTIHLSSCLSVHQFKYRNISSIYPALHLSIQRVRQQAGNICTAKTQSEQTLGFSCGVTYKA